MKKTFTAIIYDNFGDGWDYTNKDENVLLLDVMIAINGIQRGGGSVERIVWIIEDGEKETAIIQTI